MKVGMVVKDSTITEEDLGKAEAIIQFLTSRLMHWGCVADFAVRRIKAIRAMAVHKGEVFEEKKNRIIKETRYSYELIIFCEIETIHFFRFRRRLLEESGQLPTRHVHSPVSNEGQSP